MIIEKQPPDKVLNSVPSSWYLKSNLYPNRSKLLINLLNMVYGFYETFFFAILVLIFFIIENNNYRLDYNSVLKYL